MSQHLISIINLRSAFTILVVGVLASLSLAQEVSIDAQGQKITRFADGSWRYYQLGDSIYPSSIETEDVTIGADINPAAPSISPSASVDEWTYRTFQKYVAAAVKYEAILLDQVDRMQNDLFDFEDERNLAESNENVSNLNRIDQVLLLRRKQLQVVQKDLASSRKLIKRILKIGHSSKFVKLAKVQVPGLTGPMPTFPVPEDESMLLDHAPFPLPLLPDTTIITTPIVVSKARASEDLVVPTKSIKSPSTSSTASVPTASSLEEMSWSSAEPITSHQCNFAFNGIDGFTNELRKELQPEVFFTHTDPKLKIYLKEGDFMTCSGFLTSISGGFRYLTLSFEIASKNARREFGGIRTGSLLNLKLVDGSTVSLYAQSGTAGIIDPISGHTVFTAKYPLDYQKEKFIEKSEIDRVRVVWSAGYEDYDVYNVDFFMNQLTCLKGK